MQRLWSRAAPATTCRQVTQPNAAVVGVTRGATAASKRRLRFANSFTAFYSSIFAAAALADAQVKDKRRVEWEERIAAVKEEVDVLVGEEQRLISALESRKGRRVVGGTTIQSRSYSTTVPRFGIDLDHDLDERELVKRSLAEFDNQDDAAVRQHEADDEPEELRTPIWLAGPSMKEKAIRVLALKQLAIRLMLRPTLAHDYEGLPMKYAGDNDVPRIKPTRLLTELNNLRKRIDFLRENENVNVDDIMHAFRANPYHVVRQDKFKLDNEVEQITNFYLSGRISLQEYLLRVASNLSRSIEPDRPRAFKIMLLAFTHTRQNDLGLMVLRTLFPNRFRLSSPLIITILNFYRKTKDLLNFDLFLQMLIGGGYPVNLGKMPHFRHKVINGIDLTIPPLDSSNPVLYAALISACLRFDQPERADAYLQAARLTGYMDDYHTLFAYLKFYAIRQDWWNGVNTLKRAIAYMGSTSVHIEKYAERLIFLMVHLCDCCEKSAVSEAIIKAAVESGFDPKLGERQQDIEDEIDPLFERWIGASMMSESGNEGLPIGEKCFSFLRTAGDVVSDLGEFPEEQSPARLRRKWSGHFSQFLLSSVLSERRPQHICPTEDAVSSTEPGTASGSVDSTPIPELDSQNAETSAPGIFIQQAEDISLLRRDINRLDQRLDGATEANKFQTATMTAHNDVISLMKDELRELRKVSKITKESYQAHEKTSTRQGEDIRSLKYEVSELKESLASERGALNEALRSLKTALNELNEVKSQVADNSKTGQSIQADIADSTTNIRDQGSNLKAKAGALPSKLEFKLAKQQGASLDPMPYHRKK